MKALLILLFCFINLSCASFWGTENFYYQNFYETASGIPKENIQFSPIRYKGERGKVYVLVQVQPTDLQEMQEGGTVQLYNQSMKTILKSECAQHFKTLEMGLGWVEYLEVQTKRMTNFSFRTWARAKCHGYMKSIKYNL